MRWLTWNKVNTAALDALLYDGPAEAGLLDAGMRAKL
jgi:hypothetical protein